MQIEAVYRHGVFEPLGPVDLKEDARVQLNIQPAEASKALEWFERVRARRDKIYAREGILPDSTPGIAEDRLR